MITITLTDSLHLHLRSCVVLFTWIILLSPHDNTVWKILIFLTPLYIWGKEGLRTVQELVKVTYMAHEYWAAPWSYLRVNLATLLSASPTRRDLSMCGGVCGGQGRRKEEVCLLCLQGWRQEPACHRHLLLEWLTAHQPPHMHTGTSHLPNLPHKRQMAFGLRNSLECQTALSPWKREEGVRRICGEFYVCCNLQFSNNYSPWPY